MVTVLEKCTAEEQHSVVHFLWAKGLSAQVIHKNISCLRWEVFVA
jgi:hypothetical protein